MVMLSVVVVMRNLEEMRKRRENQKSRAWDGITGERESSYMNINSKRKLGYNRKNDQEGEEEREKKMRASVPERGVCGWVCVVVGGPDGK